MKDWYHTQEKRRYELKEPIICEKDNAWLGVGYYFWFDEGDAVYWGMKFKTKTGKFDIYKSQIVSEDILDTVFNQEHYEFWLKQIEKVAKNFVKKTGNKPTLKEINYYFHEKGVWKDVDGIIFQDISENPVHFLVKDFQYKKRIQLAVYKKQIICNFAHHYEGECV